MEACLDTFFLPLDLIGFLLAGTCEAILSQNIYLPRLLLRSKLIKM